MKNYLKKYFFQDHVILRDKFDKILGLLFPRPPIFARHYSVLYPQFKKIKLNSLWSQLYQHLHRGYCHRFYYHNNKTIPESFLSASYSLFSSKSYFQ